MLLSREKINNLSRLIMDAIDKNEMVDFLAEDNEIRLQVVKVFADEVRIDEMIDEKVRKILSSYAKKIFEGSDEWNILYKNFYAEEMNKRKGFAG